MAWYLVKHRDSFTFTLSQANNKLAPWSRDLLGKVKVAWLVNKCPAFYGTRRFISVFTRAHHWTVWARWIQSTSSHPSLQCGLVLRLKLCGHFWSDVYYMPNPFQSPWFFSPNLIIFVESTINAGVLSSKIVSSLNHTYSTDIYYILRIAAFRIWTPDFRSQCRRELKIPYCVLSGPQSASLTSHQEYPTLFHFGNRSWTILRTCP